MRNPIGLIKQITQGVRSMIEIWVDEYRNVFSDSGVMVLFFAATLAYPLLYSMLYSREVLREVPIAVVDRSQTSDSRAFIRNINATADVEVMATSASIEEAKVLFKNKEVRGILLIPETYASDLALNRQTTISAYADMSYFLYYKALLTAVNYVSLETGKQIQLNNLMKTGLTYDQAQAFVDPVRPIEHITSNQTGGYGSYLIPAVLVLILHQTLILGIGMLAGTARERNRFSKLVPVIRKRMGTFRLVLGKSAAYFTIYALLSVYMLGFIPHWFQYPHVGSFWSITALIVPFLLATIFFALTISVFFKNRENSMLLFLFTSIPLLFLSGVTWPLQSMPTLWLWVREVFPSSHAIMGYIKINSMGASMYEVKDEIVTLWLQTGLYFITACFAYRFQVRHAEKLRIDLLKLTPGELRKLIKNIS